MTNTQGWAPASTPTAPTTAQPQQPVAAASLAQPPPQAAQVLPPIAELPKFRGGHITVADLPLAANRQPPFPQPTWAYDKDEHGRKTGQMHVVMPTDLIDAASPLSWHAHEGEAWLFCYVFSMSAQSEPSPVLLRLREDDVSPQFQSISGQDPYLRTRCLHVAAVNQWAPRPPSVEELPALQAAAHQDNIAASITQGEIVQ